MKMLEAHPIWRLFRKSENNNGGRAIFNYQNIYMKNIARIANAVQVTI